MVQAVSGEERGVSEAGTREHSGSFPFSRQHVSKISFGSRIGQREKGKRRWQGTAQAFSSADRKVTCKIHGMTCDLKISCKVMGDPRRSPTANDRWVSCSIAKGGSP